MACNFPLKRWIIGKMPDGTIEYKVTPANVNQIKQNTGVYTKFYQEIPCGKCMGCRLDYAREWATRCVLEAKQWEYNEMLTLTYDDDNLPTRLGIDITTGEKKQMPTLVKKDVQDFLKRLRKLWNKQYGAENIRYYMCGEYGETYGRPHYHLLMFNFKVEDKKLGWYNKEGNPQYTSEIIKNLWGKGLITLCPVTYETCEYVARYIEKKQKGPTAAEEYLAKGQIPEYTCMSRKPGIAYKYFEENKETLYETQKIWISTQKAIKQTKLPRYFDKLYDIENPEQMEKCKKARKELAKIKEDIIRNQTNIGQEIYRAEKEKRLINRQKKMIRKYEASI